MATIKHTSFYTNTLGNWTKDLGAKPTEAQLAMAHVHGRNGKQSFILAMALRDAGVSRGQMLNAAALFDGKATPQLNHLKALVNARMFVREPMPGVYKLVAGPKHQEFADLHGAKAAAKQPAPAPKKARAKKPVAAPALVIEAQPEVPATVN